MAAAPQGFDGGKMHAAPSEARALEEKQTAIHGMQPETCVHQQDNGPRRDT